MVYENVVLLLHVTRAVHTVQLPSFSCQPMFPQPDVLNTLSVQLAVLAEFIQRDLELWTAIIIARHPNAPADSESVSQSIASFPG